MIDTDKAIKASFFSIISNLILTIIKISSGIIGNSYALIADGFESAGDVFSSVMLYFGIRYSKKPSDKNHPYGHGRIEPLITFLIVLFLVVAALVIIYKSIEHIKTPHKLPETWTLIVLGCIILWKEFSYRYIKYKNKDINSTSLKADAWHHRSDALTSVAAFIGILITVIMGEGYETADDWAALVAAVIIIYNSYRIFRPALSEFMDEHTFDDLIADIRGVAKKVEGIEYTEKCFVRKVGFEYHVDLHASVNGSLTVTEGHAIAHRLKDRLKDEMPQLGNILIHIEPDK